MKKRLTNCFLLLFICFLTFRIPVFAEENTDNQTTEDTASTEIETPPSAPPIDAVTEAEPDTKQSGLYQDEDGDWFYYKQDGTLQLGWLYYKGYWYYFDGNNQIKTGVMLKDCTAEINGKIYFFGIDGNMLNGWIKKSEGWYYAYQNGAMANGWIYLGGIWYYLDGSNQQYPGLMAADQKREISGHTYFFNSSGEMLTGWIKKPEGWYYANTSGAMIKGWIYIDRNWYYLDGSNADYPGLMIANQKRDISGHTYFFNSSGEMLTGWIKKPEGWYYAGASGAMITGWIYIDGNWYYLSGSNQTFPGLMIANQKKEISGRTYFFNSSGEMLTGWIKRPEGWYYAGASGAMAKGWIYTDRNWYYLDGSNQEFPGLMIANSEKQIGAITYRFNSDGSMVTGWYRKDNKWYYYDLSGAPARGWRNISGVWYYLSPEDYSMLSSQWKEINGIRYYFLSSGAMAENWLSWDGNWYYMGSDGGMKTGWQKIDGYWYYMYPAENSAGAIAGTMARSTFIGKYQIASDGRMIDGRVALESVWHTDYVAKWNTNYQLDSSLSARLNSAIAAFTNSGNTVSFVMTDINTGQVLSYKAGLGLYSASCIKGPYVLSVLDAGYSPTASIWNTINWSSNSDYANIRRTYGAGVFQNWLARAGVSPSQGNRNYTTTTSLDLAKMWTYGYDFLAGNKANSQWARSTFQHVLNSAMSNTLGNTYEVYSKAGWIANGGYYNVYTDAGIVMAGSYPYVISIMSNCSGTAGMARTQNLVSVLNSIHSQMVN